MQRDSSKRSGKMLNVLLMVFGAGFGLFLLACFVAVVVFALHPSEGERGQAMASPSPATEQNNIWKASFGHDVDERVFVVSAARLVGDYESNEIRADSMYKAKIARVSGEVDSVGRSVSGAPYITLTTGNRTLRAVQCVLEDSEIARASRLAKGDQVTVVGRVAGMMGNVLVRECVLAR